jgi:hypothetical protein
MPTQKEVSHKKHLIPLQEGGEDEGVETKPSDRKQLLGSSSTTANCKKKKKKS